VNVVIKAVLTPFNRILGAIFTNPFMDSNAEFMPIQVEKIPKNAVRIPRRMMLFV
jgi:hypothetical protein